MKVEGFWFFEDQTPERVWEILHNPASLVQVVPDMHHLVRLSPTHYQFVLHPAAAVLNLQELVIDLELEEAHSPEDDRFTYRISGEGAVALVGSGRMAIRPAAEQVGAQLTVELIGEQQGPWAAHSDFLLETQIRAGLRRLWSGVGAILRGEAPEPQPPAAANTAREVWLIFGAIAGLLLVWFFFLRGRERE